MKSFYKTLLTKGKTIQWLSEQLGVSHQTIYQWKLGKTKPRPKYLLKIAKLLNLDIEKLIKESY